MNICVISGELVTNAVVRGKVLINGSAAHVNFWKYD